MGGSMAPSNNRRTSFSGLQWMLNAASPARIAIIRCHSGVCDSDASRLGAGW